MNDGEYIPLYWDGEPDVWYVKGHVSEEVAKEQCVREEAIKPETEITITHAYARWVFSDESARSEGHDRVFRRYKQPGRGAFKVTEVRALPESGDDDLSQGQESPDDECVCGHKRSSHGDWGCYVFLGNLVGDCPCEEFDEA
jgi:hypothetical protein